MERKLCIMTKVSSYKAYIDSAKVYKMEDAKRQERKSKHLYLNECRFLTEEYRQQS